MSFFSKLHDRMVLFNEMMDKTDTHIEGNYSEVGIDQVRSAVVSCAACKHQEECRLWLQEVEGEISPPKFCANAERLKPNILH